jgi:cytochrome P450
MTLRKLGFGRRRMESQIMVEVDCVMAEFEKYKNNAFDIQTLLNISVANVICSVFFGKRFGYNDTKFKHLIVVLNKLIASITGSSPAFLFPWLRHFRLFNLDKTRGCANAMYDFVTEIVEEHRLSFDENEINDYIDAYLLEQIQRENEPNTTFSGNANTVYIQ